MPYPIIVNLEGKCCVVVGGGKVAERRVEALRRQGAAIRLVAPDATPSLRRMADDNHLTWIPSRYCPAHLDGAFLVVAATDIRDVNHAVAHDARTRNLLVTCADEPADGNYLTPSVIERGDLLIAVSTGGASPTLAAIVRDRLAAQFGTEWASWTRLFRHVRSRIQTIPLDAKRRAAAIEILNDLSIQRFLHDDQFDEAEAAASRCILSHSESAMPAHP